MAIGDTTAQPATHKGRIEGAHEDTVFLSVSSTGTLSELATDLGQEGADLTTGTNVVYESSGSTRFDYVAPWAIEFKLNGDSTDTGTLYFRDDGVDSQLKIRMLADQLSLTVDNTTFSLSTATTALGIDSGGEDFYVGCAAEPNLDTTGASDAVRYWMYAYAPTAGTFTKVTFLWYDVATFSAQTYFLAEDSVGTNAWAGTCEAIRFSKAFHTSSEFYDAFVGLSDPGNPSAETRTESLAPVKGSAAGDDGQFVAVYPPLAIATQRTDLRTLSPLHTYQNHIRSTPTWRDWISGTFGEGNRVVPSPADSDQEAHVFYVIRRPIDRNTTHIYVRMRFKTNGF